MEITYLDSFELKEELYNIDTQVEEEQARLKANLEREAGEDSETGLTKVVNLLIKGVSGIGVPLTIAPVWIARSIEGLLRETFPNTMGKDPSFLEKLNVKRLIEDAYNLNEKSLGIGKKVIYTVNSTVNNLVKDTMNWGKK